MGGTFMSLPLDYRDYFVRNLHDALSGHSSSNVAEAVRFSEQSRTRCIGLTIETRPDYCLMPHLTQVRLLAVHTCPPCNVWKALIQQAVCVKQCMANICCVFTGSRVLGSICSASLLPLTSFDEKFTIAVCATDVILWLYTIRNWPAKHI